MEELPDYFKKLSASSQSKLKHPVTLLEMIWGWQIINPLCPKRSYSVPASEWASGKNSTGAETPWPGLQSSGTFKGVGDLYSQLVVDTGEGSVAGHQGLSSVDETITRKTQDHTTVNMSEHAMQYDRA